MGEWFWDGMIALLAVYCAVSLFCTAWCLLELRRNWRSAPELWGLDWLDVVWRLERELGVHLTGADFGRFSVEERGQITAGRLWDVAIERLRIAGTEVPGDGLERVVKSLCEALNVDAERITPDSRLYEDLGMPYGMG
jgi:acyl carrier protein